MYMWHSCKSILQHDTKLNGKAMFISFTVLALLIQKERNADELTLKH